MVHGGIRHLENNFIINRSFLEVHGGIRHLEKNVLISHMLL